jgi:uncharacterized membrane protein
MQTHAQDQLLRGIRWLGLGIGVGAAVTGLTLAAKKGPKIVTLKATVTIRRNALDVYHFWRELSNLPRFMRHLERVTEAPASHTSWVAKGPVGTTLEWEADIVVDRPGERIAWRSQEGATLPNHGAVLFRPAARDQGTELHLTLGFEPPGGALSAKVVRLFHEVPQQQLKNDLRRLKQILETGELVYSDATIHRGLHAARPASNRERSRFEGLVQS